jgi:very-short-patch-repair endonuclease
LNLLQSYILHKPSCLVILPFFKGKYPPAGGGRDSYSYISYIQHMPDQLNNRPEMLPFRRKLRNHMTAAEVALWVMIKDRQLEGERFRRQFRVGHYVLDFYCPKHKLAVELDGAGHFTDEGKEYDAKRTEYLNSVGIF